MSVRSASLRSGSIGRIAWTAAPSSDGIGGEASPTRAPPASVVACATRSLIWASCCSVERPSPSHSRITGRARLVWKPRCSSVTRVDSALSGRNAAESFSCDVAETAAQRAEGAGAGRARARTMIAGRNQRSDGGDGA